MYSLQSICEHSLTSSSLNTMNQALHLLFSPSSPRKKRNSQPKHIIGGCGDGDGSDDEHSMCPGLGQWEFNSAPWTLHSHYKNNSYSTNLGFVYIFTLIRWDSVETQVIRNPLISQLMVILLCRSLYSNVFLKQGNQKTTWKYLKFQDFSWVGIVYLLLSFFFSSHCQIVTCEVTEELFRSC